MADAQSRTDQQRAFSRVAFEALGEPALETTSFPDWETAIRFVASRARSEALLLALDEFGHLCDSDPALPSILRRLWDAELRETRLHVVLCGSYVSFMEREVLERRTPVTDRNPERTRRGRWRLSDPFFRFWFRFVLPNRSVLEAGDAWQVWNAKIAPFLDPHVSTTFEEVCAEHLGHLNRRGVLPA